MATIKIIKEIDAPVETVFTTVADIREFSKAIPHILRVEFLSDRKSGKGTKFRETREINGKEISNILEVTEYKKPEYIRIISDSQGTIWDTKFVVTESNSHTLLTMTMDARANTWIAKIMNPMLKYFIKKEIQKDIKAVKAYCESLQ